ncbi:hypothetical protein [Paracoccus aestuarii]|uniref:hypothetical protein n=1 Tax=Paracoccus aestuarii TaxID=453842 RepID=UPI0011C424E9|nr:hypothetical protein [Paracoccus aestuarii]WCR01066.1 hypothetical protein JHW48_16150 [Paracoccus aestuarii]
MPRRPRSAAPRRAIVPSCPTVTHEAPDAPDTILVEGTPLAVHPGPVAARWSRAAAAKGFDIAARVIDRLHLALCCRTCGHVFACRISVLTVAQPICHACLEARRSDTAIRAALVYLGRDPQSTAYGFYRARCGHVLRRQYEIIIRVAEGLTGLRCETCFAAREAAIAAKHGWTRIGPDPEGNPNYHLYRHVCGTERRLARANLSWGQVDCPGCGQSWSARESRIYLLDLRHDGRHFLKLGYSAHPTKRHRHQLGLPKGAAVRVLRELVMPTGAAACAAETRMHRDLCRSFPDAVVPQAEFADMLNVTREIYRPALRAEIEARLDALAARIEAAPSGSAVASEEGGATRSAAESAPVSAADS